MKVVVIILSFWFFSPETFAFNFKSLKNQVGEYSLVKTEIQKGWVCPDKIKITFDSELNTVYFKGNYYLGYLRVTMTDKGLLGNGIKNGSNSWDYYDRDRDVGSKGRSSIRTKVGDSYVSNRFEYQNLNRSDDSIHIWNEEIRFDFLDVGKIIYHETSDSSLTSDREVRCWYSKDQI